MIVAVVVLPVEVVAKVTMIVMMIMAKIILRVTPFR